MAFHEKFHPPSAKREREREKKRRMNARENLLLNFLVHPGRYDFKKCKTVNDGSSLSYFEVMKGKYEGQRIIYNFYCPFITPNQPHTEIFYCCFQVFMLTQALFTLHLLFFLYCIDAIC